MHFGHKILVFFSLLGFTVSSSAQSFSPDSLSKKFSVFSAYCSPEKLYLHLDRTYFTSSETIWFKGYLSDAMDNSKMAGSNFIYVELLDKEGSAVCRIKVKRKGSGFPGYMTLPETLKTGRYTLRAYTLWQLNSDPEYLFNQTIDIVGDTPAKKKDWQETDMSKIDISFYPEGGRYFAGTRASIAFKAMDNFGRSATIQGSIVDSKDNAVVGFTYTAHDGMGRFSFTPQDGEKYFLQLNSGRKYPLPEASSEGASINLRKYKGKTYATICGTPSGRLFLLERNKTFFITLADFDFDGHTKAFALENELLRPGINHLLLADNKGNILSERLFFQFDTISTVCTAAALEKKPKPHGLIHTSISLKDSNGNPLDGECSVAIVRGSFKNHMQNEGLPAYMLLSSELKGHLNNPDYYFDKNINEGERELNLDLLMMTQGWKYYDYSKMVSSSNGKIIIKHFREYIQSIKGRINRARADKLPRNFIFSVMIPKKKFVQYTNVKEANSFTIDSLDFKEGTEFLISVTKSGFGRDFIPRWSGDVFAMDYKYFPAPGMAGVPTEEDKIPLLPSAVQVDTLQAAVVSAKSTDAFDNAFGGRSLGEQDLKAYGHMTVVEYITMTHPVFEYNGDIMYNRRLHHDASGTETEDENGDSSNSMSDFGFNDESGKVKLIYKDNEEPWWPYENIHMEQVEAIHISTMADPVYNSPGGLVMIKLKEGAKIAKAETKNSLLYFIPLGYQKAKKFYSPRYDQGDKREEFDHRNTIFWSPSTQITQGMAFIPFCNTDQMDYPYIVRIEGITAGGTMFSGRSVLNFEESY